MGKTWITNLSLNQSFLNPTTYRIFLPIYFVTCPIHQSSQISFGSTVLITAQWPRALVCCQPLNRSVSFFNKTSPSPSNILNTSSLTSCFGSKNIFRAPLPRKSASVGFLNVTGSSEFVQKITMLVKSRPSAASFAGEGASDSLKIRQVGNTDLIV